MSDALKRFSQLETLRSAALDHYRATPDEADFAWTEALERIGLTGHLVAPRGQPTLEVLHATTTCALASPVVTIAERKLSYSFAAAESLAILAGDDRVETVARFNPNIAKFSDDGVRFSGAYGPRVAAQLKYVVGTLVADRDTRQAVASIWTPNPAPSKDIPCTLALVFSIRGDRLDVHAFMRSSDVWLGLPYDLFNFSVIGLYVACHHNLLLPPHEAVRVRPGYLYLTAASSHLYEANAEAALAIFDAEVEAERVAAATLDPEVVIDGRWDAIDASLVACRDRTEAATAPVWKIRP